MGSVLATLSNLDITGVASNVPCGGTHGSINTTVIGDKARTIMHGKVPHLLEIFLTLQASSQALTL
ncbi:MAG: hypothetical protein IPH31_23130 [Lewinellaceae bacterium]|nr:hypothetical protein [Lewinellaceae bacterium]